MTYIIYNFYIQVYETCYRTCHIRDVFTSKIRPTIITSKYDLIFGELSSLYE